MWLRSACLLGFSVGISNDVVVFGDPRPSYDELAALVERQAATIERLEAENDALQVQNTQLAERVAELERRLGADSSNSSRPPSSDAPWAKKPARKRSSRTRSGRKPGKQPGAPGSSRSLGDDCDELVWIEPSHCGGSGARSSTCQSRRPWKSPNTSGSRRSARAVGPSAPRSGTLATTTPRSSRDRDRRCGLGPRCARGQRC